MTHEEQARQLAIAIQADPNCQSIIAELILTITKGRDWELSIVEDIIRTYRTTSTNA